MFPSSTNYDRRPRHGHADALGALPLAVSGGVRHFSLDVSVTARSAVSSESRY